MSDHQHDPVRPWTPGPWVSMAGTEDDYVEVEGMGGIRVEGAYRCDGYPVTVAAVVSTDEAGWEGIGCTYATARLVALAPEMAEALLDRFKGATDAGLKQMANAGTWVTLDQQAQAKVVLKLRALSRPAEEATQ